LVIERVAPKGGVDGFIDHLLPEAIGR